MPEEITLTLGCFETDRVRPILDGRIRIPGVRFQREPGEPQDLFRRALRDKAFDVTELSLSSHMLTTARGDAAYIGVPVFPSRAFRHSAVYIRKDRGIRGAADLAGRRIGLPEYQQTAALWVRGMLRETYGVDTRSIAWRIGGLEQPGPGERVALSLPPELDVRPIGAGESLNGLLAAGEIDAIIGPRPPSCFTTQSAPVERLWPDYRAEEERYFDATGFFPLMHCMAVRKDVAAAHPWLPAALFRAYAEAKALALAELAMINVLRVSLPWIAAEASTQTARFGGDPWPYGFWRNREEIAAMLRFAREDGLVAAPLAPEDLFDPTTLELSC